MAAERKGHPSDVVKEEAAGISQLSECREQRLARSQRWTQEFGLFERVDIVNRSAL